ncbi:hypothetical protein [Nocardia sp. NPDC057030]|uniref:hypothetical protein n=1 Tax=unclassified Nocardia TaxID=2637762 RepID=UPI00362BA700
MRIKYLAAIGIFAATSVAQILGSPSAAAGTPTDCVTKLIGRGAIVTCGNSNGGSYRATAICISIDGTQEVPRTAPIWVQNGASMVTCPEFTIETHPGVETRDY